MKFIEALKLLVPEHGTNAGHGHVWIRPDGARMPCGGPALCKECAKDRARLENANERIDCTVISSNNNPPYVMWPDGSISI